MADSKRNSDLVTQVEHGVASRWITRTTKLSALFERVKAEHGRLTSLKQRRKGGSPLLRPAVFSGRNRWSRRLITVGLRSHFVALLCRSALDSNGRV